MSHTLHVISVFCPLKSPLMERYSPLLMVSFQSLSASYSYGVISKSCPTFSNPIFVITLIPSSKSPQHTKNLPDSSRQKYDPIIQMKHGIAFMRAIALQLPSCKFSRNTIANKISHVLPNTYIICSATITLPRTTKGMHSVIRIWEIGIVLPKINPQSNRMNTIWQMFWARDVRMTVKNYQIICVKGLLVLKLQQQLEVYSSCLLYQHRRHKYMPPRIVRG